MQGQLNWQLLHLLRVLEPKRRRPMITSLLTLTLITLMAIITTIRAQDRKQATSLILEVTIIKTISSKMLHSQTPFRMTWKIFSQIFKFRTTHSQQTMDSLQSKENQILLMTFSLDQVSPLQPPSQMLPKETSSPFLASSTTTQMLRQRLA